jgi:hypothetical protein
MMLEGVAAAVACMMAGLLLAVRSLQALGDSAGWLLACALRRSPRATLRATGSRVIAPFSGREALWVRARVLGPPPDGGASRALWTRELRASCVVRDEAGEREIDWERVDVVVARAHRGGTVKVLEREHPVLSRILARAGYARRPAGSTLFVLEEEIVLSDVPVRYHGPEAARGGPRGPARGVLSPLDPARLLLRLSWGPLLALWFSTLTLGAGVGLLLAALRLSRLA